MMSFAIFVFIIEVVIKKVGGEKPKQNQELGETYIKGSKKNVNELRVIQVETLQRQNENMEIVELH